MTIASDPLVTSQRISTAVEAWLDAHQQAQLMIGNRWVPAQSGKTFESINPATENVLAHVAEADRADVDDAVKAAREAFDSGPWPRMSSHDRARVMRRFGELLEEHADQLAELETLDNGMTIGASKAFFKVGMESYHFFAGQATVVMRSEEHTSELQSH